MEVNVIDLNKSKNQIEEIENEYEEELYSVKNFYRPRQNHSSDYWNGYQQGLLKMFHIIRDKLNFVPETRKPTEEEQKLYYDERMKEEPHTMLQYRGQIVPIYLDDYGQQDYIIFRDEVFGGGAFNIYAVYDFCDYIDDKLNEEVTNQEEQKK